MSDAHDEGHADSRNTNNNPAIKKGWSLGHYPTFLLNKGKYVGGGQISGSPIILLLSTVMTSPGIILGIFYNLAIDREGKAGITNTLDFAPTGCHYSFPNSADKALRRATMALC